MRRYQRLVWGVLSLAVVFGTVVVELEKVSAAAPTKPFSVEVTPSIITGSIKPGDTQSSVLKIHNTSADEQHLKIVLRAFVVDSKGNIQLQNNPPSDVASWVTLQEPTFGVKGGEWFSEHIQLSPPKDSGFSYSFAIVISPADQPAPTPGSQALQGSVAVFALINIDRPGAIRQFSIDQVQSQKHLYEYLPASFSIRLKNTGNTIVQPQGNIFIQRTSSSQPVSVLSLNANGSYLLPGMSRDLTANWSDGFPVYTTQKPADNVSPTSKLTWDWGKAQHFRFGRYTASVVAIYNDGQRDVPVMAEVSFWVVPWKLLLGVLVVAAILVVGVVVIVRKVFKLGRYAGRIHRVS